MQVTLVALRSVQHSYMIYVETNIVEYYLRNGYVIATQPQEVVFLDLSEEESRKNALVAIEQEKERLQKTMEYNLKNLQEQQKKLTGEPPQE